MTHANLCEFCEGTVEHRQIRARFHFHGQTIYVDNVPAWVCTQCGEQFATHQSTNAWKPLPGTVSTLLRPCAFPSPHTI